MSSKPSPLILDSFCKFHPKLPTINVPFQIKSALYGTTATGTHLQREWLTFDDYFAVFVLPTAVLQMFFSSGLKSFSHVSQRIRKHEYFKGHNNCVNSHFSRYNKGSLIDSTLKEIARKCRGEEQY